MKVNDLMDKDQMNAAYEAGKRLAKIVSDINLTPKQPKKKASFGDFFQATLPKALIEIASTDELRELEVTLQHMFGWDVQCSHHFAQRTLGREANIPISAIIDVFKKLKAKYQVQVARVTQMGKTVGDVDVVVQDYGQKLNVVFVLGKKMILKTVMAIDPDQFHVKQGPSQELKFKV